MNDWEGFREGQTKYFNFSLLALTRDVKNCPELWIIESESIMEKKLYSTASDILICTCSNHVLLAAGSTCELCMGLVAELSTEDVNVNQNSNQYDEVYFEALERWYEDMEFAA